MGKLTDDNGKPLQTLTPFIGSYIAPFIFEATSAPGLSGPYELGSPPTGQHMFRIKSITGNFFFTGTAAAAVSAGMTFSSFNSQSPATGASTVFPIKKKSGYPASTANIRQSTTGSISSAQSTGINTQSLQDLARYPICIFNPHSVTGQMTSFRIDLDGSRYLNADSLIIHPGQTFNIRLNFGGAIGDGASGCIEWDEYECNGRQHNAAPAN
jgi:hypothetical protein